MGMEVDSNESIKVLGNVKDFVTQWVTNSGQMQVVLVLSVFLFLSFPIITHH